MITRALPAPVVRRGARAAALSALPLLVLATAPAHAEAAEGWFPTLPEPVDPLHAILWFVVAPVAIVVALVVLTMIPALIRREPILIRHGVEGQWIGGPGKGASELPEATSTTSGGASGSY